MFLADQCEISVVEGKVSLLVTEVIGLARFRPVYIGEVAEFKPGIQQLHLVNPGLTLGIVVSQQPAILAQNIVDVAHEIGRVAVQPIVVHGAAVGRTKLLVRAASKWLTAFETFLFHVGVVYTG